MTALAADRDTPRIAGELKTIGVEALRTIFRGALVMKAINDEFVRPGATALGYIAVGRAVQQIDNSAGADGDLDVDIDQGIFGYETATGGGDDIAKNDIGSVCYIVDDQTVGLTSGSGTRSLAGIIHEVDEDGLVYVQLFPGAVNPQAALAYTRSATIVVDRTLLASASATALNNNNVLAGLILDLEQAGILVTTA